MTLAGSGTLTMSSTGAGSARIFADNANWRLINNSTMNGFGNIGAGQTHLTNNGLIDANVSGKTLFVQVSDAINNATMQASNGGTLQFLNSAVSNASTIQALNGSTVQIANSAITGGIRPPRPVAQSSPISKLQPSTVLPIPAPSISTSRGRSNSGPGQSPTTARSRYPPQAAYLLGHYACFVF